MDKTKHQRTHYNDELIPATNRFTQHCSNFAQNASDVPFCTLTATIAFYVYSHPNIIHP